MNTFVLAGRLLKRDWHVGELKILISALIIAVASMTSIGLFTQRLNLSMNDQTGQFLGADLILSSPREINKVVSQKAESLGLKVSMSRLFSSVVVANETFQLAQIKAVDDAYPLLGKIKYSKQNYGAESEAAQGPVRGDVWVTQRLLDRLKISVGDYLELGDSQLLVSAILKHEPGQANSFMPIAPRLLMHYEDVVKTGVIQPGSRITYQYLFSGLLKDRQVFIQWLEPQLNLTEKLIGGKQGSPALNSALDRAEQYLSLAAMLSVMLAGIAIAMAANRYSQRHFDQTALMRCMGATQTQVIQLYGLQLLFIGALASLAGCVLGYLAQLGLVSILAELVPGQLPEAGLSPLVSGFFAGLVTLVGFSLPSILRLKSVPPLRVLRRDSLPLPVSVSLVYGFAIVSLILLMWWQSGSLKLTLIVLMGTMACVLMLAVFSSALMLISRYLLAYMAGPWRIGLQQIIRYRRANQIQMLSLGLALMLLLTVLLLRTDLLSRWQAQLPDDAPNQFAINIQANEVDAVARFLRRHSIPSEGLYPMVRARIAAINNIPVLQAVVDTANLDEALKRELNISWADGIQKNNQLVEGKWWSPEDSGKSLVSIEQGLAKRLDIKLGDTLTFQAAEKQFSGRVTNIRAVQWDSFQPNFYVIFPPETISHYPHSYITSFYLANGKNTIANQLVKTFPGLTIIDVDAIMNQVKLILDQVTLAIEYVMLFVLLSGLVVLMASLQSSMDDRIQMAVIMRTMGAKSSFLVKSLLSEFVLLGLFAGLLAMAGTELIAFGLYSRVFNLGFEFHPWFWLLGPGAGILIIVFAGWLYTRQVSRQSPVSIMNSG